MGCGCRQSGSGYSQTGAQIMIQPSQVPEDGQVWSYDTLNAVLLEAGFIAPEFPGAGRLPGLWRSMIVAVQSRCDFH